ncbi:MAG: hypothetical protein CSB06_01620 [Bacteroidia bacterium]|nr:MAG: hypothetical protein CSB06_01620 [Bacteroidia bacterium]
MISSGQSPPQVSWMEMNTPSVQLIFPKENEEAASKILNYLEYIQAAETHTLKVKPKKISLLLNARSVVSNGFVQFMPFRSVWFATPPQRADDLGSENWLYTLGVHEYRHVVQMSKNNRYFTRALNFLFGDLGWAAGEYSIPPWFFEGDAVCTETALTSGGRGRIPKFLMPVKAILNTGLSYKYDCAKLGSFKRYYPNHYHLGYELCADSREMFGREVFDKTLDYASKISFWPFAFSRGLKKTTGLNERRLFDKIMQKKRKEIKAKQAEVNPSTFFPVSKDNTKDWRNYDEVKLLNDSILVAKKTEWAGDITALYLLHISTGKERKLIATNAKILTAGGNTIYWSETLPDLRWSAQSFSDIFCYDIKTRKQRRLTFRQKLFAPTLSPDRKFLACVEYGKELQTKIVLLDTETGKVVKSLSAKKGEFFRTPSWDPSGEKIVFAAADDFSKSLKIWNIKEGRVFVADSFGTENIGRPVFYQKYILYNSPYDGIGNIYALDTVSKKRFRVTCAKFGAYDACVKDHELIYRNYTASGYNVVKIKLDTARWVNLQNIPKYDFKTARMLSRQEKGEFLTLDDIPRKEYPVKKYQKWKHALHFHSRYPTVLLQNSGQETSSVLRINLLTTNMLKTISGQLQGSYDFHRGLFGAGFVFSAKTYFPELQTAVSWQQRAYDGKRWDESAAAVGLKIPLNWSRGVYVRKFALSHSAGLLWATDDFFRESPTRIFYQMYTSSLVAEFLNMRKRAVRDLYPKFGQEIQAFGTMTLPGSDKKGRHCGLAATAYLPGFFAHHSFVLKGAAETQIKKTDSSGYYSFKNNFSLARGYDVSDYERQYKVAVNYAFPLWYPDINLGPILYFKRLYTQVFFDYSRFFNIDNQRFECTSAGMELYVNFHIFRVAHMLTAGFRASWLFAANRPHWEFLFFGLNF